MGSKCCGGEKEYGKEIYITRDEETTFEKKIERNTLLRGKNPLFSEKPSNELNSTLTNLLDKKFSLIDSKIQFSAISKSKFDEILNKNVHYKRIINNLNEEINNIPFETDITYHDIEPIEITSGSGDRQYYKGSFNSEGKCQGPGVWTQKNNIYLGNFYNDEFSGKGIFINENGDYYFGEWKNNKYNGVGSVVIKGIEVYQGEFKDNKKSGEGIENFPNMDIYFGHFDSGKKHGNGKYIFSDGTAYEGQFDGSKIDGKGKIHFNDGKKFCGEFQEGIISGKGELLYGNGIKFKGQFLNNKKNGKGEYIWPDGKKFKGKWKNNIPDGHGTFEDKENKIVETIKYKNGHIIKD